MKVQLLMFAGCPNVDATRSMLRAALDACGAAAEIEEIDVTSERTPASLRGWGSPTVLIDGVDVAGGEPGESTSCRLYPGGRGPSEQVVREALERSSRSRG